MKVERDATIVKVVHRYGSSQSEIAECMGLHCATVSRLAIGIDTRDKT